VDEVIKRLYIMYDTAPAVERFYVPQLANFLTHGELERAERLELFLLDKGERSMHFAHRTWFFLNAWVSGRAYRSELCSAAIPRAGDASSALLRAVEVQGAIAAARFIAEAPAPEARQQLRRAPAASQSGGSTTSQQPALSLPPRHAAVSGEAGGGAVAIEVPPAASAAAAAASFLAPPAISSPLRSALDAPSLATFLRIRANLGAAAAAAPSFAVPRRQSMSSNSPRSASPTPVKLEAAEDEGVADLIGDGSAGIYGGRTLSSPSAVHATAVLGPYRSPASSGRGGLIMRSPTSAQQPVNTGPLQPAGGAGGSLAYGPAGGMAAFQETISLMVEFERIGQRMGTIPVEERSAALREALRACARRSLPSRAAYVPLGNVHNQLVAIHADHSFCFKTAKRAPFMVVLEVIDYANASGGPLDEDDSEDEDDARDKGRLRRAQREYVDHKQRRAARRARMEDLRARAGAGLRGPGGAAGAGNAAVRLVAEGVRDAADRMGEAGRELGEKMTERAHALRSYVLRKVDALTLEAAEREKREAGTGGEGGSDGGSSAGRSQARRHRLMSSLHLPSLNSRKKRAAAAAATAKGSAGAGVALGGASAGVPPPLSATPPATGPVNNTMNAPAQGGHRLPSTVAGRRVLDSLTDGAYAAFGVEDSEGSEVEGGMVGGGWRTSEIMSAPPALGPLSRSLTDTEAPRGGARAGRGRACGRASTRLLPPTRHAGRPRASSAHSDGSLLDESDAQHLIASEEARVRLQRVVDRLRRKKRRAGGGGAGADSGVSDSGMSGDEMGEEEEEVDGLLHAAALLGRDLTARGARIITQSIRFKPSLRNLARRRSRSRHAARAGRRPGIGSSVISSPAATASDVGGATGLLDSPSDSSVGNSLRVSAPSVLPPSPARPASIMTERERVGAVQRMGQWASGPSGSPPSPEGDAIRFRRDRSPAASSNFSPGTPSPAVPLLAGTAVSPIVRRGGALMVDEDLERETAEGLPDFDAIQYELDPDAPGEAAGSGALPPSGRARPVHVLTNPLAAIAASSSGSGVTTMRDGRRVHVTDGGQEEKEGEIGVGGIALEVEGGAPVSSSEVSVVFPERWREKEARIAATSPYSHLPGWRLMPVIVKADDDLRQEQFVSQLLFQFNHIWRDARVPVWLRPYDILATSPTAGLISAVSDTISLDSLKRGDPHFTTLDGWFERHFNWGPRGGERVRIARMNFARSLAAYSIVCYLLQVKDRHNGNILIDRRGHVLHIDFGFLLTNSPGGNIGFEAAPFKLTQEFVQVMGGPRSALFATFRKLCVRAFLAVRKHRQRIIVLVHMMLSGNEHLPCFVQGPRAVMAGLRARFAEAATERQCVALVHSLVDSSMDNWRTRWYDSYQRVAQGIRE
jgi:hypothetical protein